MWNAIVAFNHPELNLPYKQTGISKKYLLSKQYIKTLINVTDDRLDILTAIYLNLLEHDEWWILNDYKIPSILQNHPYIHSDDFKHDIYVLFTKITNPPKHDAIFANKCKQIFKLLSKWQLSKLLYHTDIVCFHSDTQFQSYDEKHIVYITLRRYKILNIIFQGYIQNHNYSFSNAIFDQYHQTKDTQFLDIPIQCLKKYSYLSKKRLDYPYNPSVAVYNKFKQFLDIRTFRNALVNVYKFSDNLETAIIRYKRWIFDDLRWHIMTPIIPAFMKRDNSPLSRINFDVLREISRHLEDAY